MIITTKGNILKSNAQAIVNPVNTVGVMGKGLALQIREKFPNVYNIYRNACKLGKVQIGKMFVVSTGLDSYPEYIINFPTKKHWKEKSKLWYIQQGLDDLIEVIQQRNIHSIALPAIGCGLGGLDWNVVYEIIDMKLSGLPDSIAIFVYEPYSGREGKKRPSILQQCDRLCEMNWR